MPRMISGPFFVTELLELSHILELLGGLYSFGVNSLLICWVQVWTLHQTHFISLKPFCT